MIAVDTTGVGRPVADMLEARLKEWVEEDSDLILHTCWITITGGDSVTKAEGGGIRVPKSATWLQRRSSSCKTASSR